jgi:hypothetical protein
MPLMVVDGAAGDSKGEHEFRDGVGGKVISGFRFGEICGANRKAREVLGFKEAHDWRTHVGG